MQKRFLATAIVVICLMGMARTASAQDDSGKFRPFNGLFADMFEDGPQGQQQRQPQSPQTRQRGYNYPNAVPPNAPTNSNGSDGSNQDQRMPTRAPAPQPARQMAQQGVPAVADPTANQPGIDNSPINSPIPRPINAPAQRHAATGDGYSFQFNDSSMPSAPARSPAASGPSTTYNNQSSSGGYSGGISGGSSGGAPLHERLKQFRESPFGNAPEETAAAAPQETRAPARQEAPTSTAATESTPLPAPPGDPAPSATPGMHPLNPAPQTQPTRVASTRTESHPAAESAQEPNVLFDHKSPQLSVETVGPRKIVVGKEAAYEVVLQNSGEQAAEEVAVSVGLPEWAQIAGTAASTGDVVAAGTDRGTPCRWMLRRIEAHSKEKLTLRIVPRQSKPFELAVRWDFKQAPSQALIEVQEPKLTMRLDGPREVLFGKKEVYRLKLGNSGNGAAENVVLTLMPLNSSDSQPVTHRLGTIAAGDERSIELELTARQSGRVVIRVEASGDGGSRVNIAENVIVHRGGLRLEVDGPAVQFVGTPASYHLVVRNPGDAVSKNIKVTAKLPTGMKFVSGSDGASVDAADGGKVRWTLDRLDPGEQRVVQMKCTLSVSGPNRVEVVSAADDDLVATSEAMTRVEAMADLRLEVKDPDGPVPVGSEALYELHIRNRGTKAAENVEVLTYFSNGVEPVAAEGQASHIKPGQVVFDLIPAIPPASELVLTVKAKAQRAGNHVFRAEVHCKSAGTRLVREEMTHYYQDASGTPGTLPQATASNRTAPLHGDNTGRYDPNTNSTNTNQSDTDRYESRTAERQVPLPLPQSPDQPMPTRAIKR